LDFPNIQVRGNDLLLPISGLSQISYFAKLIFEETQPRVHSFNLYEEWKHSLSPFACFCRLMLILRAYRNLGYEIVNKILGFPDINAALQLSSFSWPSFDASEWDKKEAELTNEIILDFAKKNNVDPESISSTVFRKVILGCQDVF